MFWTDGVKLGSSLWEQGWALQETALAAAGVIHHRTEVIGSALCDPAAADHRELDRMVSEKVSAVGEVRQALAQDWLDVHADLLAQGQDMLLLLIGLPSGRVIERIGRRSSRLAVTIGTVGGRALKPVHRVATANDRRLKAVRRAR